MKNDVADKGPSDLSARMSPISKYHMTFEQLHMMVRAVVLDSQHDQILWVSYT